MSDPIIIIADDQSTLVINDQSLALVFPGDEASLVLGISEQGPMGPQGPQGEQGPPGSGGGGTDDHAELDNLAFADSGHTGFAGTGVVNTFTIGPQTIQTGGNSNRGLIVRANSALQTVPLQEWQSSTGTVRSQIDPLGRFGIGTAPTTDIHVRGTGGRAEIFIDGPLVSGGQLAIGANGNRDWRFFTTTLSSDLQIGDGVTTGVVISFSSQFVGIGTSAGLIAPSARLHVATANDADVGIKVTGTASQTANLQEWHTEPGVISLLIDNDGIIATADGTTVGGDGTNAASITINPGDGGDGLGGGGDEDGNGGSVTIIGGAGGSGGTLAGGSGGDVIIQGGAAGSGPDGQVFFRAPNGDTVASITSAFNVGAEAFFSQIVFLSAGALAEAAPIVAMQFRAENFETLQCPMIVVGVTGGQSAKLQEWYAETGFLVASIDVDGGISTTGGLQVGGNTILGALSAGQINSGDSITADTFIFTPLIGDIAGTTSISFDSGVSTVSNTLLAVTGDVAMVPLIAKGAASQTANLQQWQSSAGTPLSVVDKDGYAFVVVRTFVLALGEAATTGNNKTNILTTPYAGKIVKAYAVAKAGPTGADLIFDINKNGSTIWSTQANRLKITAGNTTGSQTTFDTTSLAAADQLTIDIDQVGSTIAGQDITVELTIQVKNQ